MIPGRAAHSVNYIKAFCKSPAAERENDVNDG